MVSSSARSVKEYLAELPAERAKDLVALVKLARKYLPGGYNEPSRFFRLKNMLSRTTTTPPRLSNAEMTESNLSPGFVLRAAIPASEVSRPRSSRYMNSERPLAQSV